MHELFLIQMVYSSSAKLRVLHYKSKGYRPYTIANLLKKNDGFQHQDEESQFLKVYEDTQSIARRPGSGRLSKITATVKQLVEQ